MISCDECQKRIVVILDAESGEGDEAAVSAHLKECLDCQSFRREAIAIRRAFGSAPLPPIPASVERQVLQEVTAEAPSIGVNRPGRNGFRERRSLRFRRLAWAGGLAGLCLVLLCVTLCLFLASQVADLKQELRVVKRGRHQVAPRPHSSGQDEESTGRILSASETSTQLRRLLRVGSYYAGQRPFWIRTVQSDIDVFDEGTPEKLLALAEFWKHRARLFVEEKAAELKKLRKNADPSFDPIIQFYIEALEAYEAGSVQDSLMLLQKAERLWEKVDGEGAPGLPGRVLVPKGVSDGVPSARVTSARAREC